MLDNNSFGSVDHETSSIGSRLTDPKCRKDNGTYVTDTEKGESSFASVSSDDEPTSSDDDNDDEDSEEDYSLSACQGRKWATKNGYNLTTFDQLECGGKWTIDLPLPLPMWSKESKPPLVIDKVCKFFI